MKSGELRAMTEDELVARERNLRSTCMETRFGIQSGQVDNVNQLRNAKREIARIRTILRERQLGLAVGAAAGSAPAAEEGATS